MPATGHICPAARRLFQDGPAAVASPASAGAPDLPAELVGEILAQARLSSAHEVFAYRRVNKVWGEAAERWFSQESVPSSLADARLRQREAKLTVALQVPICTSGRIVRDRINGLFPPAKPPLRHLDLGPVGLKGAACFRMVFQGLMDHHPQLRALTLGAPRTRMSSGVAPLPPGLTALTINLQKFSLEHAAPALEALVHLRSLGLHEFRPGTSDAQLPNTKTRIHCLSVSQWVDIKEPVDALVDWSSLRHLKLTALASLRAAHIAAVSKQLRVLEIGLDSTKGVSPGVFELPAAEQFSLRRHDRPAPRACWPFGGWQDLPSDRTYADSGRWPVHMPGARHITCIGAPYALDWLRASGWGQVQVQPEAFRGLRQLTLRDCKLQAHAYQRLRLPVLEDLDLSYNSLGAEAGALDFTGIQRLNLAHCGLKAGSVGMRLGAKQQLIVYGNPELAGVDIAQMDLAQVCQIVSSNPELTPADEALERAAARSLNLPWLRGHLGGAAFRTYLEIRRAGASGPALSQTAVGRALGHALGLQQVRSDGTEKLLQLQALQNLHMSLDSQAMRDLRAHVAQQRQAAAVVDGLAAYSCIEAAIAAQGAQPPVHTDLSFELSSACPLQLGSLDLAVLTHSPWRLQQLLERLGSAGQDGSLSAGALRHRLKMAQRYATVCNNWQAYRDMNRQLAAAPEAPAPHVQGPTGP